MLCSPGMVVTGMVLLSLINLRISSGQQCTEAINASEALDCNFHQNRSMCSWQNVSTPEISHHWIIEAGVLVGRFQGNDSIDSKARIKSQLICATDTEQHLLKFRYGMTYNKECQLTIFLTRENDTNFTGIFTNAAKIDNTTWESVNISSPSHDFKLVFQAKKPTYNQYCEIILAEIKFQPNGSPSTTEFSPTSDTTEEEEGGLSGGAVAGIIVGLILVVALCVFVFLLIRRRNTGGVTPLPGFLKRLQKSKQSNSKSATDTASVNYSAHAEEVAGQRYTTTTTWTKPQISGPMHVEAPHLGPGFEWKSQSSEDDVMESSNYYSMPVDEHGNCVPLGHVNERAKRGTADYDVAVLPESDGGYCTPDDVDVKDSSNSRAQVGAPRANVAGGGGSNYNKLHQTAQGGYPKTKNTDTYSHIQEQDNVYKVPRSGTQEQDNVYKVPKTGAGSVYSLATNPEESDGRPSARANAGVKGKGAAAAPSERADYHHLNLKDGRSATPDASRGQGQKGGVYSHLSNQGEAGDNYNRVEFDKHTQRKQSAQCHEPYNHLSGGQV